MTDKETRILNKKLKSILEWICCIIAGLIIAVMFKYYVGSATVVKQTSMYPTLVQDQRLWLNRWPKTTKTLPARGEIITFEAPSKSSYTKEELQKSNLIAQYENEPQGLINKFTYYVLDLNKQTYIKRVIGLPGEYIEIKDGKIYINGDELQEDYLQEDVKTYVSSTEFNNFVVPENCVFALGDNREYSKDCRAFGCIPLEKIEGTVTLRIWPLDLWGKVN